jgi:ABC-type multidrug transport system fused ATPase/permease subunit
MGKLLWEPSEEKVKEANMTEFIQRVRQKYDSNIQTYRRSLAMVRDKNP